jgi:hypothetical protein
VVGRRGVTAQHEEFGHDLRMAVFLANVGVNASHSARSPLFRDGSFTVIPIPDRIGYNGACNGNFSFSLN